MTVASAAGIPLVDGDQAPLLARPYYASGDPGPIVAALAHVPELLDAAMPFLSVILGPSSIVVRRKELVILRTSARLGCRFCVKAHTVVAADAGLSRAELRALRGEALIEEAFVDPTERAILRWVDAVAGAGPVAPAERDALGSHLPTHEVVELTTLIGATMMLNRFCTALDLPTASAIEDRLEELDLR
jgi:AhpD family alkylhydroperoxidase